MSSKDKFFQRRIIVKTKVFILVLAFVLVATLAFSSGTSTATEGAKTGKGGTKYGGTLSIAHPFPPEDFDQAYRSAHRAWPINVTNELAIYRDYKKGPLGTGKLPFNTNIWPSEIDWAGYLCESWDISNPVQWILKVRPGIHFHDKPPVNGREMTAEDLAVSYHRGLTMPGSWASKQANKPTSIEATDKYTVVVDFESYNAEMPYVLFNHFFVVAKESVWDENGNETEALRDWKNACGTGAFILTDYVEGVHLDYVRNDNYWQKDPIPGREGNQLPYVDGMRVRIIEEVSTRIAALRAGKIDATSGGSATPWVQWEEAEQLKKTNPELKYEQVSSYTYHAQMNVAVEPFTDIRVRKALSMAIDREALIRDLYGGNGDYFNWWLTPNQYKDLAVPFDELPKDLQEQIIYNPEKAKQLLAEAGYPNGFETKILLNAINEDLAIYLRDQWKKIGVTVNVDVREESVRSDLYYSKKYEGMHLGYYNGGSTLTALMLRSTDMYSNFNNVADPYNDEQYEKIISIIDPVERNKATTKHGLWSMGQVWDVAIPSPNYYCFWQPYLKGFEGGFYPHQYGYYTPFTYVWIDKE
jgi:peptide/nickel transport system substrate-binding protein